MLKENSKEENVNMITDMIGDAIDLIGTQLQMKKTFSVRNDRSKFDIADTWEKYI